MGIQSVRILGRSYKVVTLKRMKDAGQCDYVAAKIKVKAEQDEHERKDAVVHEIFHGILYQQGREYGGEVEETYVRALATGFIAVLQDNPEFAAWLGSHIQDNEATSP